MSVLKSGGGWRNPLLETPKQTRQKYTELFARTFGVVFFILALAFSVWYLLAPWKGGVGAIAAIFMSALICAVAWLLIKHNRSGIATALLYVALVATTSVIFWQTAYFVDYLYFSVICVIGMIVYGRLVAFSALLLFALESWLYVFVFGLGLTAPDGQKLRIDALTFILWWVIIGLSFWLVAIIYNNLIKDNLKLKQNQETLALAQQLGNIGNYTYNIATKQVTWSDQMFRINGLEPGQIVPTLENGLRYVHPDDIPLLNQRSFEAVTKGYSQLEVRTITHGGELRNVLVKLSRINDSEGKPESLLGTVLEITERKQADLKLQEQAFRGQALATISQLLAEVGSDYTKLLDTITKQISLVIGDGCSINLVSSDNQRLELVAIYHPDPENISSFLSLVKEAPARIDEGNVGQVFQTGQPLLQPELSLEQVLSTIPPEHRQSATKFRIYSRIIVPLKAQGRIIGVLTLGRYKPGQPYTQDDLLFLQDLADRAALAIVNTQLYKSLQENELRLRRITDNMLDIICESDRIGICQYISPSCEAVLGFKPEEMIGKNLFDFVYIDDLFKAHQAAHTLQKERQSTRADYRYLHRNGSYIWLEVISRPLLNAQGAIESVIFTGRDISERKKTEEKLRKTEDDLRHAQKMEAIGRLAGGVAHDFNNLLTVINVCGEFISDSLPDDNPLKENAKEILNSGLRAADLTRQLLLFSRQQVHNPRVLDLNTVVVDIEKLLRRLIHENIEFVVDLQADLDLIKADASQLEQVIMNLAVNARDAMPNGGRLLLETKNIEVDEAMVAQTVDLKVGCYILLTVSDTGTGISANIITQIFDPYFTTKDVGKGTGLGLAMVYGIVKQSGGHIQVYSEVGHGTSFKIYLPVASNTQMIEKQRNQATEARAGYETILVVEDDPTLLQITCRILEEHGYCVLSTQRPNEAIKIVQDYQGTIHLLLTDMIMPNMSGQELAERLLQQKPELKVLYFSGYTDNPIFLQQILNSEVENFLQKPFTIKQLLAKVSEILGV